MYFVDCSSVMYKLKSLHYPNNCPKTKLLRILVVQVSTGTVSTGTGIYWYRYLVVQVSTGTGI